MTENWYEIVNLYWDFEITCGWKRSIIILLYTLFSDQVEIPWWTDLLNFLTVRILNYFPSIVENTEIIKNKGNSNNIPPNIYKTNEWFGLMVYYKHDNFYYIQHFAEFILKTKQVFLFCQNRL